MKREKMIRLKREDFDLVRFPNEEIKLVALKSFTGEIEWKYGAPFNNGDAKLSPSEELIALMQLTIIVGKLTKDDDGKTIKQKLYADFLPFKRQDKDKLIGEIKFNTIYEILTNLEVHEVAPHDSDTFASYALFLYKEQANGYENVVFPDCGAQERFKNYDVMVDKKGEQSTLQNIIMFTKSRNAKTGELTFDKFTEKVEGKAVIFDDIISYGGTFKHVAKELKKAGATYVKLVLNHADGVHSVKSLKEAGIDEIVILNGGYE